MTLSELDTLLNDVAYGTITTHRFNLMPLTGSEKQVAWATKIRNRLAIEIERELRRRELYVANPVVTVNGVERACREGLITCHPAFVARCQQVMANTAASYWIDRRDESIRSILRGGLSIDAIIATDLANM